MSGGWLECSLICDARYSGGAKVGPAGARARARAPAVKTCAPAVPQQLAGRWAESRDSSIQLTEKNLI